jgi:hypothetical protein
MLCGFRVPFEEFAMRELTKGSVSVAEYVNHPEYRSIAAIVWGQNGHCDNDDDDNNNFALAITYNSMLSIDFQAFYAIFGENFA